MASDSVQKFIEALAPQAISLGAEYGLDPKLIIAQGALESGWGESASGNNVFGVKSHGEPGGQNILTHEEVNGQMVPVYDNFRVYDSTSESMRDYAKFLQDNPRYKNVFGQPDTDSAIDAVAAAGYATDSEYANKLKNVARMIDLSPYMGETAMGYSPTKLPQIGPVGGPALRAINNAAPAIMRPAAPKQASSFWQNPLSALTEAFSPQSVMRAAPQAANGLANGMLGTIAGRTAIMRAMLPSNIGAAPSIGAAGGAGTQAMAYGPNGASPVSLMRSSSGPSQQFDNTYHSGQNMDVYRANRESIGGPITQSSIDRTQSGGGTVYRSR